MYFCYYMYVRLINNKEKKMKSQEVKLVKKLVSDLYFDYDRLTSSGQETFDKIADLLGVSDTASDQELLNMGLPKKYLKSFRQNG